MNGHAIFAGDVSWDSTLVAGRLPELDEKVLVQGWMDGVGGVAANSAWACVLAGAEVLLVSSVGNDITGAAIRADLATSGMTVNLVTTRGATTRSLTILDKKGAGEKRLFLYPGARMFPTLRQVKDLDFGGVRWMHTALYDIPTSALLISRCNEAGIPWSIDLEPATIPREVSQLGEHLDGCSFITINSRAANLLGQDAVGRLRGLGVETIIETRGPGGVRVHRNNQPPFDVIPPVSLSKTRDTTGAGDAFAGWLVAGMLRGDSMEDAIIRAVEAASWSVLRVGTTASYPTREEMEVFRRRKSATRGRNI